MSNEIDPKRAFEMIARIAALIANAEVSVEVTKKSPHDATDESGRYKDAASEGKNRDGDTDG